MRVRCLAQEHNTVSPARARTQTTRSGDERTNHEATAAPTVLRENCKKILQTYSVKITFSPYISKGFLRQISQGGSEDVQQYILNSFYFRFRPLMHIKANAAAKLNWNRARGTLPDMQRLSSVLTGCLHQKIRKLFSFQK